MLRILVLSLIAASVIGLAELFFGTSAVYAAPSAVAPPAAGAPAITWMAAS